MRYILDLFTPETWRAFRQHGATVSGFRHRQRKKAAQLVPGDIFVCYLVHLSRWCGLLEITSSVFEDDSPIFQTENDSFIIRFRVKPLVLLDPLTAIPISEPEIWSALSWTRDVEPKSFGWAGAYFRQSLRDIPEADGRFLHKRLMAHVEAPKEYPLTTKDERALRPTATVRTPTGQVNVEIPGSEETELDAERETLEQEQAHPRDSIRMQGSSLTSAPRWDSRSGSPRRMQFV
jgi:hypothetical protein